MSNPPTDPSIHHGSGQPPNYTRLHSSALPSVPTFAGLPSENVNQWVSLVDLVFRALSVSPEVATAAAVSSLRGAALQRGLELVQYHERVAGSFPQWDVFKGAFVESFVDHNAWLTSRVELASLQQSSTLHAYIEEFTKVRLRIPDASDMELVTYFVMGLKRSFRADLLVAAPRTLASAISRAQALSRGEATGGVGSSQTEMDLSAADVESLAAAERKRMRCYHCKKPGHVEADCRIKKAEENKKNKQTSLYSCLGSASLKQSGLIILNGTLNGLACRFLIDSGASDNFVTSSFLNRFRGKRRLFLSTVPARRLTLADGSQQLMQKGLKFPRVKLNGVKDGYEPIKMFSLFQSDSKTYDAILGLPWLMLRNPRINWSIPSIELDANEPLALGSKRTEHNVALTEASTETVGTHPAQPVNNDSFIGLIQSRNIKSEDLTSLCFVTVANAEEQTENPRPVWLRQLLDEFQDVFSNVLPGLPSSGPFHQIKVHPDDPICTPLRRMSPLELDTLRNTINDLLARGLIRPSESPWGAPVLFVKKKDGSLRLCVDYRALNAVTIKNRYPIPLIDELLDRLSGAHYFSALDLCSGYHQVRMHPDSVDKTAFRTRYGSFEWLVMPFGLTNAPATFMSLMNQVFKGVVDKFAIVYLDDILIFSKSEEEHAEHLRIVLDLLKKHGLLLQPTKCQFLKTSVEYLGHRVRAGGIQPSPAKIAALKQWPIPKGVDDIRKFLGLTGFYRRFVNEYASIARPLTDLLCDNTPFVWSNECETAFVTLRDKLCTEPILRLPDFSLPFVLTTDASDMAVGGVLSQKFPDGEFPIAFESKRMDKAHANRPVMEQELYAVYHCTKVWRCYIEGPGFTLRTDHQNLIHLLKSTSAPSRHAARWVTELMANFRFTVEYIPGPTNVVADALSRIDQVNASEVIEPQPRDYSSEDQRFSLVSRIHLESCHRSAASTFQEARKITRWPGMRKDVFRWVGSCPRCLAVDPQLRNRAKLHIREVSQVLERWGVDAIGPLPLPSGEHAYALVAVDHASRFAFVESLPSVTAQATVNFLRRLISTFGTPRSIVTDRGTNFMAIELAAFLRRRGIRHEPTVAFHPQSNGLTERLNGTLQRALMKLNGIDRTAWSENLQDVVLAYNHSVHSSTGDSPHNLVFGPPHRPGDNTNLMERRAEALSRSQEASRKSKANHDSKTIAQPLAVGDMVFQRRTNPSKLVPPWDGPFTITAAGPFDTYTIRSPSDTSARVIVRHRDHLKLVPDPACYARWDSSIQKGGENVRL